MLNHITQLVRYVLRLSGIGGIVWIPFFFTPAYALELSMTAFPDAAFPGEIITYTITVSNPDATDQTGVVMTGMVPAEMRDLFPDRTDGGSCPGFVECNPNETITWDLGTLRVGQSITRELRMAVRTDELQPPDESIITNTVRIVSAEGTDSMVSRSVTLLSDPILTLSLIEEHEPVPPGGELSYTLTFGNRGLVDAPDVTLSALVPIGTSVVSVSEGGMVIDGEVRWLLGTIGAAQSGLRQFRVRVEGNLTNAQLLISEAQLDTSLSPDANARAMATTAVHDTEPLVVVLAASSAVIVPGEIVTYTLTVSNTGPTELSGVVLTDVIPAEIRDVDRESFDGGTCLGLLLQCLPTQTITWDLGTLIAGQTATRVVPMPVNTALNIQSNGGLILNTARVIADGGHTALTGTSIRICRAGGTACDHQAPPSPTGILENPQPDSFHSGVSLISGWLCSAVQIDIEIDGVTFEAAYGTSRADTEAVCGDANNGFGLLVNWNLFGTGPHEIRALADGVVFAQVTITVTTFGVEFFTELSGQFDVQDFPSIGTLTTIEWQEALQNFVIVSEPGGGGGTSGDSGGVVENPQPGAFQSGAGIISGWRCAATQIDIEIDGVSFQAAYGTSRADTQEVCGDTNNGFGLVVNWNLFGAGQHEVQALADGIPFALLTVNVTTFGVEFLIGASGQSDLPDFPIVGTTTTVEWQEALQNFTIVGVQ